MNKNANKPDSKDNRGRVSFAVFNMNPLNITPSKDANGDIIQKYVGEITVKGAKHRMFQDWEHGTAAAFIHLWRYINGLVTGDVYPKGTKLNTIEKIISTWAPITDGNDTPQYIQYIVQKTALPKDYVLNFEKKDMIALVKAMSPREDNAAAKFLTDEVLANGWAIANKFLSNKK